MLRGYVLMAEQLREGDTAASQEAEALSGAALGSEASTDCTSQKHAQLDFQGPLVTAALQGLLQMAAPTFQEKLPVLFALLTDLIKCQAAPMEVRLSCLMHESCQYAAHDIDGLDVPHMLKSIANMLCGDVSAM